MQKEDELYQDLQQHFQLEIDREKLRRQSRQFYDQRSTANLKLMRLQEEHGPTKLINELENSIRELTKQYDSISTKLNSLEDCSEYERSYDLFLASTQEVNENSPRIPNETWKKLFADTLNNREQQYHEVISFSILMLQSVAVYYSENKAVTDFRNTMSKATDPAIIACLCPDWSAMSIYLEHKPNALCQPASLFYKTDDYSSRGEHKTIKASLLFWAVHADNLAVAEFLIDKAQQNKCLDELFVLTHVFHVIQDNPDMLKLLLQTIDQLEDQSKLKCFSPKVILFYLENIELIAMIFDWCSKQSLPELKLESMLNTVLKHEEHISRFITRSFEATPLTIAAYENNKKLVDLILGSNHRLPPNVLLNQSTTIDESFHGDDKKHKLRFNNCTALGISAILDHREIVIAILRYAKEQLTQELYAELIGSKFTYHKRGTGLDECQTLKEIYQMRKVDFFEEYPELKVEEQPKQKSLINKM